MLIDEVQSRKEERASSGPARMYVTYVTYVLRSCGWRVDLFSLSARRCVMTSPPAYHGICHSDEGRR